MVAFIASPARTWRLLRGRLPDAALHRYLAAQGVAEAAFAGAVAQKSSGDALYLHHVIAEIATEGPLSRIPIADLPHGLLAYYALRWRAERGQDEALWRSVTCPVLCALACALAPVTAEMLRDFAEVADLPPVAAALARWDAFLLTRPSRHTGELLYELLDPGFAGFIEARQHDPEEGVDLHASRERIIAALRFAGYRTREPVLPPPDE